MFEQRSDRRDSRTILLILGFAALITTTTRADAPSAAAQEAQQKLDQGNYSDAIRVVTQALTRTRPTDDSPERCELLMIKAEALLRMGQNASAINTFDVAFKGAPDARSAALARATAVLIRNSAGGKYMPKAAGAKPINIQDPQSRKEAFLALQDDLAKALKPKYDAALRANTLPPIIDVLPAMLDVLYVEYAAKGTTDSAKADLMQLGQHARNLMSSELNRLRHQLNVLEDASNSTQDYIRRGLFSNERQALEQQVIPYLSQIEKTARDARARARSLGFDGAAWEPIIADAQDQIDRAQAMISASP